MKKIISAAALMMSLSACEKKNEDTRPLGEMRKSAELIAEMGAGWNLGNTMDADGSETAWGNPVTTKEMIDEIHNAGFNTLRIPTTWERHMGEAPDYKVDEKWINRVEEIVGYALENDMYVILNTHHETKWIKPAYDGLDDVKVQLAALWTQIAEHFKDYGDHLVFEGLNEPRIVGGTNEWNGGAEDGRDCINQLNEIFVETVRKTDGNNATRTLLITTFAAQPVSSAINALTIPNDEYIGVSIHAYTPYRFTYDSMEESWNTAVFDDSCAAEINSMFESLNNTFISKGIPVIITEYGSVSKMIGKDRYTSNIDEVAKWAAHYVGTAKKYGIPCVWWDNGCHDSGSELFGIFNRRELT
ncbi:MAG: glycoside hydrolase family 5 protein, partial [Oscillospiraceae bacterium]|nr:glycoside hydrolase family 5 protein [Oscillospiraceae bacterium]